MTVRDMSVAEAAWLAGFFDGEGSLTVYMGGRNRQYPTWNLSLPNTHLGSLERCREISGAGSISEKTRDHRFNCKRIWVWQVHSQRNIAAIVTQMLPYLTIKRAKADEFLARWSDLRAVA